MKSNVELPLENKDLVDQRISEKYLFVEKHKMFYRWIERKIVWSELSDIVSDGESFSQKISIRMSSGRLYRFLIKRTGDNYELILPLDLNKEAKLDMDSNWIGIPFHFNNFYWKFSDNEKTIIKKEERNAIIYALKANGLSHNEFKHFLDSIYVWYAFISFAVYIVLYILGKIVVHLWIYLSKAL